LSFPETQWSLVNLAARGGDDEQQRAALATLLHRYLPALRNHLVAIGRIPADSIDDLLQGFVADEFIARRLLERVRRERGRFRAFLLVTLNHYAVDQYRKEAAGARRPANGVTALDDCTDSSAPVAPGGDPAEAYALAWARFDPAGPGRRDVRAAAAVRRDEQAVVD
jgi:RNA polymerase sigma-70 factor (ECF subfamily)